MDVFVTRRPVFDRKQKVYAYELDFRTTPAGAAADEAAATIHAVPDEEVLALELTDGIDSVDLDNLTDGRRGMLRLPVEVLSDDDIIRLPRDRSIVVLPRDLPLDAQTVDACRRFKRAGLKICLDGYGPNDPRQPLTRFVDLLRIDVDAIGVDTAREISGRYHLIGLEIIAESVNSFGAYERAQTAGADFFQGRFFTTVRDEDAGGDLPAYKVNYLTLLQQIHAPEIDIDAIERIIRQDVSLTYRLLAYINSAAFGLRNHVRSIRQALVLLGEKGIRRWGSLISVTCLGKDRPNELMVCSLIRAHFCEGLGVATNLETGESELFLLGLFSLIDAIAGKPMAEMLQRIPLAPDVNEALLGGPDLDAAVAGRRNRMREILDLAVAYEVGDWDVVDNLCARLGVDEAFIPDLYVSSLEWSRRTMHGGRAAS